MQAVTPAKCLVIMPNFLDIIQQNKTIYIIYIIKFNDLT